MPFLILIVLVSFLSCAAAGLDAHAVRAMTAVGHGAVALAAIVLTRTRAAAFETLKRFETTTWAYAALLLLAMIMSGAIGIGASRTPYAAEQALVSLAGLGFLFVAVSAIATAVGRNRIVAALQWSPVALALLTIIDRLDGRGDFFGFLAAAPDGRITASFPTTATSAAVFGLFAILAVFAIVDHLTRRVAPAGGGPEPALTRRLVLPVAALVACANLILLSGEWAAGAAALAGIALLLLVAWRRQRRSQNSRKEAAYAASVVVFLGTFAALLHASKTGMQGPALTEWLKAPWTGTGLGSGLVAPGAGDVARWLAEGGLIGAGALLAAFGFLLWELWRAEDHGRKPSRGFALGAGLVLCAVLNGSLGAAFASPAAAGVLAALLGVASAYIDPPAVVLKVKPNARTRVL